MAVVQMQKITITGLVRDKKDILSFLMKKGVVDVQDIVFDELNDDIFAKGHDRQQADYLNYRMDLVSKALLLIEPYDTSKKPLFKVRRLINSGYYDDVAQNIDSYVETAEQIIETGSDVILCKNEINGLESEILSLVPWTDFNIPLNEHSTDSVNIITGTIPDYVKPESYESMLEQQGLLCQIQQISKDRINSYIAVYVHKHQVDDTLIVLKRFGFNTLVFDYALTASNQLDMLKTESKNFEKRMADNENKLREYAKSINELQTAYDHMAINKGLLVVEDKVATGSYSFVLDGWIPQKAVSKISDYLERHFVCHVAIRDAYDDEDFPVLLENGFLGESVSGVTEMFSLPNCREYDPNSITAVFFALFFGMMLSDAGYGLVMVIACTIILLKFRLEKSTSKFIKLMLVSGIATVVVGALYGSWFGNLVPTLLSDTSLDLAIWFDPISDPNRLLLWSLILGILHIYVGYAIKGYNSFRKRKYLDAILDAIPWYLFYTSAAFMVSSYIPSVPENIYNALTPIGTKVFPFAIVIILLTQGRKSKGVIGKLFGGVASLYDLISFMGDVLSYSRLLAMGLATGVIATIINRMGAAGGFTFGGIIAFTLIFIVGHGFNFAINALGAYVHSSRLQYIEFFNKFFEGGGTPFEPLHEQTKYIINDYKAEE